MEQTSDDLPLTRKPLWTLSGDRGNRWQRATVPLQVTSPTFHLIFLATYNGMWTGDIAIDDISLKPCASKAESSTKTVA